MPNWVFNTLIIEGNKENINDVRSVLNTPFSREHENWDVKEQKMITQTINYSNPVFSFWNIIRPTDLAEYAKQPTHDLTNGNDWYSWNIRNWGTKWDVAVVDNNSYTDTEIEEIGEGIISYRFNTAWSPPIQAIEKLSIQHPKLKLTLSYEEEQGWGGEISFLGGHGTELESYDTKCRECDATNTLEYCEDCGDTICLECKFTYSEEICEVHRKESHANA
jgi:hypothetical protein